VAAARAQVGRSAATDLDVDRERCILAVPGEHVDPTCFTNLPFLGFAKNARCRFSRAFLGVCGRVAFLSGEFKRKRKARSDRERNDRSPHRKGRLCGQHLSEKGPDK
jgi:hypothetical protein